LVVGFMIYLASGGIACGRINYRPFSC